MTEKDKAILDFAKETLAILAYQPTVPREHVKDLAGKVDALEKALEPEER